MFSTILKFELSYWMKNPLPYIISAVFFLLTFLTMWGMTAEATIGENTVMQNSESKLYAMHKIFSLLFILIIPSIIGMSIFRDYTSRMYTLLYSFPFKKHEYILGKFLSAFIIIAFISITIVLGLCLGSIMPGVKQDALLPFNIVVYLKLLLVYLLPNTLFISVLAFAVVVRTRNIYIGFISIILIIILKGMITGLLASSDLGFLGALLDPLGELSVNKVTSNWTLEERNFNSIPLFGIVFINRLVWLSISIMILVILNKKFEFNQFANNNKFSKINKSKSKELKTKTQIKKICIPEFNLSFARLDQLRTSWHLSRIDFRSIALSWPFLSILLSGLLMVLFQQYQMNPEDGVVVIPTTSNMLRVPMFMFSGVINFLTFLYTGILMFRSNLARMNSLVDTCPQPNWVFLLSKLIAITKMQFLLLAVVMMAGITAQLLNGYYKFEVFHYIFELFILHGLHFIIWSCMTICMHSISKNMYLGFFFLLMIPMGLTIVPSVAEYIGVPLLKEEIFRYNSVKGQFLGFDYSIYNGYGSQMVSYFTYKIYWLIAGIGLLLIALLAWKRGFTFTIKERISKALIRFTGPLKFSLILGFIAFIFVGFIIYHQEYKVSKVVFSEKFTNDIMAKNEKIYGEYENLIHPILSDVNIEMQFYPTSKSYKLSGKLSFTNKLDQSIDTIIVAKSFKDETIIEIKNTHQIILSDDTMHYEIIKLANPLAMGDTFSLEFKMENYKNSFLHHNSRIIKNGNYILGNIMPQLGIRNIFIKNKKKRKKYNLPERIFPEMTPNDSTLLGYENSLNNMGLINYECIIGTSNNQQAFTMGTLIDKWEKDERINYHFKSKKPIVNTISWMSGEYVKNTSSSDSMELEMYRHKDNNRNDIHMINGTKASLDYCSNLFGKLDYDTLKLVEFPITFGTYATVNGNLVPFSETYLQCDIHNHKNKVFNIPFFVAAHETAHHWWGHRIDPANIKGSRIISEGMADYLSFKIVEKEFGYDKAFEIRKKMFNTYLEYRAELANETPLIYSTIDNEYLNYRKASMALYSLNNYLGDKTFNDIVSAFEKNNKYKSPPFVTSLDFVDALKNGCPDSLKYLVTDLFENITLYDNKILDVSCETKDSSHITSVKFRILKYNSDNKGKRIYNYQTVESGKNKSLRLNDYVDVTLFDDQNEVITEERILITSIENTYEFITNHKVFKVNIDNSLLLIDVNRDDNTYEVF